jgi:pimeloyl-ACP methyl ester carboxylesterase
MRSSVKIFNLLFSFSVLVLACQQNVAGFVSTTALVKRVALPTRSLQAAASAAVNEGELNRLNHGDDECNLAYRIVRPMALSSRKAAPIVVLHGGPSVPSDYLYPLEQHVPYRSIIFYDQIGCGRSSEPSDVSAYSIELALDDLEALLKKLGIRRFHLYGQSFGGILAFEYMKRQAERNDKDAADEGCLSAVLSSTPINVKQVEMEAGRLISELNLSEDDDVAEAFRLAHQCRTPEKSQPLVDAYAHAGTVWRGTMAIPDYEAQPPSEDAARMPSTMVMRGEYDFVTEACVEGWKDVFNHKFVRLKTVSGCSHHGLLENGALYGDMVDSFFAEYD